MMSFFLRCYLEVYTVHFGLGFHIFPIQRFGTNVCWIMVSSITWASISIYCQIPVQISRKPADVPPVSSSNRLMTHFHCDACMCEWECVIACTCECHCVLKTPSLCVLVLDVFISNKVSFFFTNCLKITFKH